jgi:hypothetical protein
MLLPPAPLLAPPSPGAPPASRLPVDAEPEQAVAQNGRNASAAIAVLNRVKFM